MAFNLKEYILFRTEVKRELFNSEVDSNFKMVANPWVDDRVYEEGNIVYHPVTVQSATGSTSTGGDEEALAWWRANQRTTQGVFDTLEWDLIGGIGTGDITVGASPGFGKIVVNYTGTTGSFQAGNDAILRSTTPNDTARLIAGSGMSLQYDLSTNTIKLINTGSVGETNHGVNIGSGGQDVYAGLAGTDLEFRGFDVASSSSSALTISLDAVNNNIEYGLIEGAISLANLNSGSPTIRDLSDVSNTPPSNNYILQFNSGTGVWTPVSVASSGAQGPQGYQGRQGFTGATGSGATGATGPQGDTGDTGFTGATGLTGGGATGATGAQGDPGIGATGATGVQGDPGFTGATGATGSQGLDGVSFDWQGTWSNSTAYLANQVVYYAGSSYIALVGNIAQQPDINPLAWGLMTAVGASGIGATGATGVQGPQGTPGTGGTVANWGSYFDTTDQAIVSVNTPQVVTINSTFGQNGVTLNNGSEITLPVAATYKFTALLQVSNIANAVEYASFWLRLNGSDYPDSAKDVTLQPRKSSTEPYTDIIAIDYIGTSASPGDYIEIWWEAESTDVSLQATVAPSGNPYPDTPSMSCNVHQITSTLSGATGATGDTGFTGATGAGDIGATGFTGATGAQGDIGLGSTGATGVQGDPGFTGATGAGFTGATGATGTQGDPGFTGATGAGFTGATGSTGVQGDPGFTGATGSGATGATGAQGDPGIGATGATGVQGDPGFTGATGSGATGATGTQGFTGATGTQGFTGATGVQGDQGATGATGALGRQGATGSTGPQGFTGATGEVGQVGATGATGVQGEKGEPGPNGATGFQGLTGDTGFTGATGIGYGATGATGFTGATGAGTTYNTGQKSILNRSGVSITLPGGAASAPIRFNQYLDDTQLSNGIDISDPYNIGAGIATAFQVSSNNTHVAEWSFTADTSGGSIVAKCSLMEVSSGSTPGTALESWDLEYSAGDTHKFPWTRRFYFTGKATNEYYLLIENAAGSNSFDIEDPNFTLASMTTGLQAVP